MYPNLRLGEKIRVAIPFMYSNIRRVLDVIFHRGLKILPMRDKLIVKEIKGIVL